MLVLPFFAKSQNGGGGSFADVVRVIPRPFTFSQIFPVGNKDFLRNAFVKTISGADTIIFFVDTYGNFVRVGGGSGGGGGTVTSVGLSLPGSFSVVGSPVTVAGTLTANWITQNQNSFLLSPSGAPGTPTFRTMVAADLPAIVDSTKALTGAISLNNIGQRGAAFGQVVRWNGSAWRPGEPTVSTLPPILGDGSGGSPLEIVSGGITNALLNSSAVDSAKVVNGAISLDDIGQRGASSGQVIGWNGSAWRPTTVIISATASLDFPSTATGAVSDLTLALSGAVLGDAVCIGVPNVSVAGSTMYSGWVSAANTVTVRFLNVGSAQDPAAGTFRATIVR